MPDIELHSPSFGDNASIPRRHAKEGTNISPPLAWSGIPEDTAELVLMCEDPDAPSGPFLHWLVTGIDPKSGGVEPGTTPASGVPYTNGFYEQGWGGPLPPAGDRAHRYVFQLYALPHPFSLPDGVTAEEVHRSVDRRQLASGTLVGLYQR